MGTLSVGRGRVVVLALLVCAVASVATVEAQEPTVTGKAIPIVVGDFVNRSSYGGEALGRGAADALALAMTEIGTFEPLSRTEVDQALARLGFTVPLTKTAESRLGQELKVDYVASGIINDVYFQNVAGGRVAVADLTVTVLGVASSDYLNGARVSRQSTPRPGYAADDAELVDEALTLATYSAVRAIIKPTLPVATIISSTPSDAYLNAGSRAGLKEGMELVVMRFGERVGRLRVIEVEPTNATASITANYRGVTVGDTALPVFEPPPAPGAAQPRGAKAKVNITNALLGIAAAAGIFATLSKDEPAETAVKGVAASALTDPVGGRQGVLVTWSPYGHENEQVRLWEIWRDEEPIWVLPSQGTGTGITGTGFFFIDTEMAGASFTQIQTVLEIDPATGQVTSIQVGAPESVTPSLVLYARTLLHTPPEAGQGYVYRIVAVVAELVFTGGEAATTTGGTTTPALTAARSSRQGTAPAREWVLKYSPFQAASSPATFIASPELVSPSLGAEVTDLTDVTFSWNAVASADEYVLQISRDGLFLPVNTKTYIAREGPAEEGTALSFTVNVAQDFPPTAAGVGTLRWRIGARNVRDLIAPRTEPALVQQFPQDQGYVWGTPSSGAFTFTTVAPAAAARSGRAEWDRRLRRLGPLPK